MATNGVDYPVRFEADYPESPSRLLALLGVIFCIKGLLLIPHVIVLFFIGIAVPRRRLHRLLGGADHR